jgi:hypothetical protein
VFSISHKKKEEKKPKRKGLMASVPITSQGLSSMSKDSWKKKENALIGRAFKKRVQGW